jgi:hypothetical protein
LPAGALIVIFAGALSLRARTHPIKIRGLIYCFIGALNIMSLVTYVASISFFPTYGGGSVFVPPELYYPFYVIVIASLIVIGFGRLDWKKVEVRWGNLRTLPLEPLLLIHPSPPPKFPEPKGVQIPEAAPQVPATILEAAPQVPATILEAAPQARPSEPPAPTSQQQREIALTMTRGRPLGVTILSAYYILSGIAALAIIPFLSMLAGFSTFSSISLVLTIVSVLVSFILAYGLLKGLNWARVAVRVLNALAIVIFLAAPVLLAFLGSPIVIPAAGAIIGLILPVAIFWYMGRPHVRDYFSSGMKVIARSPIEQTPTVSPTSVDLEKLSKTKATLDSRVVTKEEFEPRPILQPSGMQSGDMLQAQLTKLKSLYDSGAITEAEYNDQKRSLLSQL